MEQPALDTKSLFAPKKGKEATKGQKQIYEGNKETIKFYSMMAVGPFLLKVIFPTTLSTTIGIFMFVFSLVTQISAIGGMYYMAKAVTSGPSNTIIDGGIDLNLKAGFADYLKDLIITTAVCTGLSSISNGFWILWLWLPSFLIYKVWVGVIAPWIFEKAPEVEPAVADKKRKKLERKMARSGGYR